MTIQTKKYKKFQDGRQGFQFLNDESHQIYEAIKHINYRKNEHKYNEPECDIDGGLWFDKVEGVLKYYDLQTSSWKSVFDKKFQITDQITSAVLPATPVMGQLWLYNGTLMYFDGSQWQPVRAAASDDSQWSNASFEDYAIVTPLNPTNSMIIDIEKSDYTDVIRAVNNISNDSHENTNYIIPTSEHWSENYEMPEIEEPTPTYKYGDGVKSQFLIPNIDADRIFVNSSLNNEYENVSKICIQYPADYIKNKIVSAVHMNYGKLTNIKKRLVKVDKINSTIYISPLNTEFYGFRNGEYEGHFLVESKVQDFGDYIPNGNCIILNYGATQNYDYILAITFDFSWIKASGSLNCLDSSYPKSTYFLSNLREPVNVHADGFKIEEAVYEVNKLNSTITINDPEARGADIQMWCPYEKQYGYIRETDLEGNGLIRLQKKVFVPLVFVGGMLIHPLYGGLKFDGKKITVPNNSGLDTMRNLSWCVVDLFSNYQIMHNEKGRPVNRSIDQINNGETDNYFENGNYYLSGEFKGVSDKGFSKFIISTGKVGDGEEVIIPYNNKKISKDENIILFIDGLMVSHSAYERNHEEGYIKLIDEVLDVDSEYLLLRDSDGSLFHSANLAVACNTGLLDDSLIYLNGKLLCNDKAVVTMKTENEVTVDGAVDNEIKYFVTDDEGNGNWKIYNQYNYKWEEIPEKVFENIKLIVSSYSNQVNSVKINIDYDDKNDNLKIYSFRFANSVSGVYKISSAIKGVDDEEDGRTIFVMGSVNYTHDTNSLNVFKNGIKLIPNIDYKEVYGANHIKLMTDFEEGDTIQFFTEPLEPSESMVKEVVVVNNMNLNFSNVYQLDDTDGVPDLFPGRVTVYINGLRLPKEDWMLLDNKRLLIKYNDYETIGSYNNYPEQVYFEDGNKFTIRHEKPDHVMIEIRKDYDRNERTIELKKTGDKYGSELYIENYDLPREILDSNDEILFYLNGQFLCMSRENLDYKLDKSKGCISFLNSDFVNLLNIDPLESLLNQNYLIYTAWKKQTGKDEYISDKKNKLTLVWR